jgi:molecular chaperone GrpE
VAASKVKNVKKKPAPADDDIVDISSDAAEALAGQEMSAEELCEEEGDDVFVSEGDPEAVVRGVRQENQQLQDRLLRTLAEFDNFKKRVAKEKEDLVTFGAERLAMELLPVVDNFERALEQARSAREVEPVVDGVEMILKQLLSVLRKFHVAGFDSVGEQFDPEKHEAMAQQEHADYPDNAVISEFQKGYMLKNRLLRPARVIVSKGAPKKNPEK